MKKENKEMIKGIKWIKGIGYFITFLSPAIMFISGMGFLAGQIIIHWRGI